MSVFANFPPLPLIDATCNIRKPHHRIRVSKSMREDIKVWLTFLSEYNGVTVITDIAWASNETLELFTDSAVVKTEGLVFIFKENGRKHAGQNYGKKWLVNYTICEMIEKIRLPFCMFST
jgi:hypothetical protein